jgi:flavin-dependent dehydrogenase
MTVYDAIVIGGGIAGISTAYNLVCQGAKTLLFDRRDVGRATDAGAGLSPPIQRLQFPTGQRHSTTSQLKRQTIILS